MCLGSPCNGMAGCVFQAANPVAVGKTRAKQMLANDGDYSTSDDTELSHKTMCVQLHGDAAFAGQVSCLISQALDKALVIKVMLYYCTCDLEKR